MADNYLITGYWGEPHVTAENDRGINAAVFGAGKFVLPVGEMFRAEYIGNNTVRIYDGKLLDNGAAAGIPAGHYIDLLIPEAGQGMKRNDLIIFQYSQDASTLIESGVFTVLPGAEVSGTAVDPVLQEEDLLTDEAMFDQMALWRVPVSGANISEPVQLFKVSKSISDIKASAVNLLDNSDFRNPVNNTGFAGGLPSADNVFIIDKWKTQQNTTQNIEINFSDSGLIIHVSTGLAGIAQRIPKPKADVTFAAKVNGKIVFIHSEHGADASVKTEDNVLLYVEWLEDELQAIIRNTGEEANEYTVEWAALYEGEYTENTLPEYQPRGYSVEAAVCGGLSWELVWQNANPLSEIGNAVYQVDLSEYSHIAVELNTASTSMQYTCGVYIGEKNKTLIMFGERSGKLVKRLVISEDTKITIQGGQSMGTYGSYNNDNAVLIPYRIFGIKGVIT